MSFRAIAIWIAWVGLAIEGFGAPQGDALQRTRFRRVWETYAPHRGIRTATEPEAIARAERSALSEYGRLLSDVRFFPSGPTTKSRLEEVSRVEIGNGYCFQAVQRLRFNPDSPPRDIEGTKAVLCFDRDGQLIFEAAALCDEECLKKPLLASNMDETSAIAIAQDEMWRELGPWFGEVLESEGVKVAPIWLEETASRAASLEQGYRVQFRTVRDRVGRRDAVSQGYNRKGKLTDDEWKELLARETQRHPELKWSLDRTANLDFTPELPGHFVVYLGADGDLVSYEDRVFTVGNVRGEVSLPIPQGRVYHRDQQTSPLEPAPLRKLLQTAFLQSSFFWVVNALPKVDNVSRPDGNYLFDVADAHFNEVQAYYGLSFGIEKLEEWGYRAPRKSSASDGRWDLPIHVHYQEEKDVPYSNAFYDGEKIALGEGDGTSARDFAKDNTVVIHEYGHFLVDRFARVVFHPWFGDGGAVHEGMADYFACSAYNQPSLGEGVMPDGKPMRLCNLGKIDFNLKNHADPHVGGMVLSSALWEIRTRVGPYVGDQLALHSLSRVIPTGMIGTTLMTDISRAMIAADQALFKGQHRADLEEVFVARGFRDDA